MIRNGSAMEHLHSCVLCGASSVEFKPYKQRGKYSLVRCSACTLVFVNPRDDKADILGRYADDQASPVSYYENSAAVDSIIFEKRLQWVEPFLATGSILDIGCNVGTFMDVATRRGWDVTGLDLNPHALDVSRKKGHKVVHGLFGPETIAKLDRKGFDLVVMNDVIEHFPNPLESLKLVPPLMKSGGYFLINTPDFESPVARTFQIKPTEHIFYFDRKTVTRTLKEAGFDIVLAKKAGRSRDFAGLQTGATLDNKAWLAVCATLHATRLDRVANFVLEHVLTDELFVLARKSPAREI
jgi:2-polyprenyl-3-methyl-5-hydroxy-6-metoxy-1,4-benzoquinol methylase